MRQFQLFVIVFMLFFTSFSSQCHASPQVRIHIAESDLKIGETTCIDLKVRDIPPVYGAEMTLTFNPNVMEVVPDKSKSEKVTINEGNFFDTGRGNYPLQNRADNRTGRIHYAVSLLNPAPETSGEGVLAGIPLRAKAAGDANLKIENIKFGTRDGRVIVPRIIENNLKVTEPGALTGHYPAIFGIILFCIFMMSGILISSKNRKSKNAVITS